MSGLSLASEFIIQMQWIWIVWVYICPLGVGCLIIRTFTCWFNLLIKDQFSGIQILRFLIFLL